MYLLSSFSEDVIPLVILGDFNIQPDKLRSHEFINSFATFGLALTPSPSTHRARNQLPCLYKVLRHFGTLLPPLPGTFSLPLKFPTFLPTTRLPQKLENSHSIYSLLTITPPTILPPVSRGRLIYCLYLSDILLFPLTPRQARPTPLPPWLSEALWARSAELWAAEKKIKEIRLC